MPHTCLVSSRVQLSQTGRNISRRRRWRSRLDRVRNNRIRRMRISQTSRSEHENRNHRGISKLAKDGILVIDNKPLRSERKQCASVNGLLIDLTGKETPSVLKKSPLKTWLRRIGTQITKFACNCLDLSGDAEQRTLKTEQLSFENEESVRVHEQERKLQYDC